MLTPGKLVIPINFESEIRNGGYYDSIKYRDWGYCKSAKNPCHSNPEERNEIILNEFENDITKSSTENRPRNIELAISDRYRGIAMRPLRPRKLCFVNPRGDGYKVDSTEGVNVEYVFISYTREQFCVSSDAYPELCQRDRAKLGSFGVAAAHAANVHAFWIDFECLDQGDTGPSAKEAVEAATISSDGGTEHTKSGNTASKPLNLEIYNICDIVRSCHSVAVVIGPPFHNKNSSFTAKDRAGWLHTWGSRLWILPELLLAPTEHRFRIFTETVDTGAELVAKRNLAERACEDAFDIRQLIDHYESTTQLSQLEFVPLALECLQRRSTKARTQADIAHAFKGLMRRQTSYIENESGFEALASWSLASHSEKLLERLICLLPPNPWAEWHDMHDAWRMNIWDVEPSCQVAGIVDHKSVLIDGAFGASIQWHQLEAVAIIKRKTLWRQVAKYVVRLTPLHLALSVMLVMTSTTLEYRWQHNRHLLVVGTFILAGSLAVVLGLPYLLRVFYRGWWTHQLYCNT